MAKAPKTAYVCNDCGAEYSRWMGQCRECKAWNTISEVRLISSKESAKSDRFSGYAGETSGKVQALSDISLQEVPRFSSGFNELDRVLGGGCTRFCHSYWRTPWCRQKYAFTPSNVWLSSKYPYSLCYR